MISWTLRLQLKVILTEVRVPETRTSNHLTVILYRYMHPTVGCSLANRYSNQKVKITIWDNVTVTY